MSREKRERLDEIIGLLRQNDGQLRFSQLYETLAYRYGTAESTVWDYLGVLKAAGRINYQEVGPIFGKDADIELVEENPEKQISELERVEIERALRLKIWAKKRLGKGWLNPRDR